MTAEILSPCDDAFERAQRILRRGGLVGLPTETVYGLAADASNAKAVASIYQAKGRPSFNPLIAHISNLDMALKEGVFSDQALTLARAFWPGPLTLVVTLNRAAVTCDLARAGLSTIALRCPAHPVAHALIEGFGGPLVAPSANPSGRLSPTSASHVAADIGDKLDLILDGGASQNGLESTIIDARGERPALLRAGTITQSQIEAIWQGLRRPETDQNAPLAPGQLLRHYAPRAQLRLNVTMPHADEVLLGFGSGDATLNLSPNADLAEAASNLFAMLRSLDEVHPKIAVSPIPQEGLGEAINDRLTRAARG